MINKRYVYGLLLLHCLFVCCSVEPSDEQTIDTTQIYPMHWNDGLESYRETWPARFRIGQAADAKFIAQWDIDVRPDGLGLPDKGEGTVMAGELLYRQKCASCHGVHGYEGPYDKLVTDSTGKNTIGNYWPYATTIFDYVRRAMPFNAPGSLSDQEVYDITAYLLYLNRIIGKEQVINAKTLPQVEMPALKRYVLDDRRGGTEIK